MEHGLPTSDSHTRSATVYALWTCGLLMLALFVCGGLIFAYQVYDTTREVVLTLGLPDIGNPRVLVSGPQPTRASMPNIAAGERVNVLLLGIDRRPTEKCPCRTDTMMIATLDPKTSTAGLLTIPRDLYVPIPPDFGENRINNANFLGALYKYPGGGPALAKRTVEYNLGRRIHYYVLVDFAGFRKAIDDLGGIDIDVLKPINDPMYPDENYGYKPIYIPAGRVHMNGEMALQYARTRHQDGDFGRSRRQIQVLMAVRDRALRLALDSPLKLPALIESARGIVETDIQPQEALAIAAAAAKVKTENIKSGSIDQTMTMQVRLSSGADVLWWDRAKVGRLLDQVIPPDTVATEETKRVQQEAARILVLNGTTNSLLAEQTARYLQTQGFQITSYGNADRFDYAKTVLIDFSSGKDATVTTLAKLFRVDPDNLRRTPNIKSDVDIRVILGADWTPPQ